MSQTKLLLDVVSDLQHLADSLKEYAQAAVSNEKLNIDDFEEIYTSEEEPMLPSAEEVRSKLARKSREGYQKQVRELITKYGGEKFSDLPATVYPELLAELEAM